MRWYLVESGLFHVIDGGTHGARYRLNIDGDRGDCKYIYADGSVREMRNRWRYYLKQP